MTDNSKLLSELLRPQQLSDLTLPQRDIERLKQMVRSRNDHEHDLLWASRASKDVGCTSNHCGTRNQC